MAAQGDKKLVRSKSGLRIVTQSESVASPLLMVEPPWVPDAECRTCMSCEAKFDFKRRRHHCRRCGKCYCSKCCDTMIPLPRMCFVDPVRHCAECANISLRENEFFDKHVKVLLSGGTFSVTMSTDDAENHNEGQGHFHLSTDQRFLKIQGEEEMMWMPASIELAKIESVKIHTQSNDILATGTTIANGMTVNYKDENGDFCSIKLSAPDTSVKKQSMTWIAAMQKAMKMLYEGRGMRLSPVTP